VRYVLFPGEVLSRTDGDRHWIHAGQLHHLYQVGRHPFIVVLDGVEQRTLSMYKERAGDIPCRPRYDGDYPFTQGLKYP
jgi:hypothetical protein